MNLYDVIKEPIITEKTTKLVDLGQYTFSVDPAANKELVKAAVEKAFKVNVEAVQIINMPRKEKAVGRYRGLKAQVKKAIVTLQKGQTIESYKI